jgi:hypothetical protein
LKKGSLPGSGTYGEGGWDIWNEANVIAYAAVVVVVVNSFFSSSRETPYFLERNRSFSNFSKNDTRLVEKER